MKAIEIASSAWGRKWHLVDRRRTSMYLGSSLYAYCGVPVTGARKLEELGSTAFERAGSEAWLLGRHVGPETICRHCRVKRIRLQDLEIAARYPVEV